MVIEAILNSPGFNPIKIYQGQKLGIQAVFRGNYLINNE